jgi:hypothetical protein
MRTLFRRTSVFTSSLILLGAIALPSPLVWAQDSKPGDKPAETKPADAAKPAEKFKLAYKAEKGRTRKSTSNFSFVVAAGQKSATYEGTETVKRTFTDVAANGDITFDEITEEYAAKFDGETDDSEDEKPKETETYTIRANGLLTKYKTTEKPDEDDKSHLDERLFIASTPIFPENAVGVGEKWSHEYKTDTGDFRRGEVRYYGNGPP